MQLIYKYLKNNEWLQILIILFSIIIILKFMNKSIIEGITEGIYSIKPPTVPGCESVASADWDKINKLLQYEADIRNKLYKIQIYKETFIKLLASDFIFSDAVVLAYLQSESEDGPEFMLINRNDGLYYLVLKYAIERETLELEYADDGGLNVYLDSLDTKSSFMIPDQSEILKLMKIGEMNVGEILYRSYYKGSQEFRDIITSKKLKSDVWRPNKQIIWNTKTTIYLDAKWNVIEKNVDNNWNPRNKYWKKCAYELFEAEDADATKYATAACDSLVKKGDEYYEKCEGICDPQSQANCWMNKWNEEKAKSIPLDEEYAILNTELKGLKSETIDNTDIAALKAAAMLEALNYVVSCNNQMGYGDPTSTRDGGDKTSSREHGHEWCPRFHDDDGACAYDKIEHKKGGDNKGQWKIFCQKG